MTDATAPEAKKLGLKLVLTGLVLATVLLTALFIHLLWANAARRNVADVVAQLNQEIIDRVKNEVRGVLDDAVAAQNAVGSVFANGTITLNEESKRDFIFLALLRSKPSLSWISLGTGDGSFFGAQRELVTQSDGDHLKLVTVAWDPAANARSEHSFSFEAKGNDIQYVSKEDPRPSSYDVTQQPWYRRALEEGVGWNDEPDVPHVSRAGISTSTPLDINSKRVGVINVVIELERLSTFLQRVHVGKSGTVVIIDRDGHVVASADATAIAQQRLGQMPMLGELGATNPLLALADDMIDSKKVNLKSVGDDPRQFEIVSPKDGRSYYVTFAALKFGGWIAATVAPASDFLTTIEQNAPYLLAALGVLTLAMAGLSAMLTNRLVVRPLTRIVGQLKHIEDFRLDQVVRIPSRLREFDGLSTALLQMSRGLASFQKYMPIELVRTLVSQGIEAEPGGEQQALTVMFTDLAGFTSLSEMLGEDVVPVLSEYLETASSAVISHRGTIDKFIGDAVMAFWGAPIENAGHARDACAAALAIQGMMMARQAQMPAGDPRAALRVRIGINTGRMLVGNIGSASRLNYTVIGDAVNVASRLEAINKRYGTAIIIGEETRRAAADAIVVRQLDWVAVYGRSEGVAIYELLAMADDGAGDRPDWVARYEAGLA
ncbi:MAG TPA: adenylate/guanylate cyclase domain-containing protein, partial [Candidatus Angelobacter sp.]|nr:adenylate/guanylate cyclase domain-containing protein [Candidatus Angelobacter sp.]